MERDTTVSPSDTPSAVGGSVSIDAAAATSLTESEVMDTQPELSWHRVAAFVRQHTHDVRNHLNGLDLEGALLNELVTDEEAKASIGRLRHQIRRLAAELRATSAKFADPQSANTEVAVRELVLIWKDQMAALNPPPPVEWHESVGDTRLSGDIEAIAGAFRELLSNAAAFGTGAPLRAEAEAREGRVAFVLTEPKDAPLDPANWGRVPFVTTRRGGYGLGLWKMDRDVAACGGEVHRHYNPEAMTLTTTLSFPAL